MKIIKEVGKKVLRIDKEYKNLDGKIILNFLVSIVQRDIAFFFMG